MDLTQRVHVLITHLSTLTITRNVNLTSAGSLVHFQDDINQFLFDSLYMKMVFAFAGKICFFNSCMFVATLDKRLGFTHLACTVWAST